MTAISTRALIIAGAAACMLGSGIRAEESQVRTDRIASELAKMDSANAIERQVATEENLGSSDAILQSQALVKAMHSSDQVIRELALTRLVEDQKLWLLEFTMSDRDFRLLPDNAKSQFVDLKAGRMDIQSFDPKLGRFRGYLFLGSFSFSFDGALARDGLTAQFNSSAGVCKLSFAGENGGYLLGGLTCGKFSIPARMALK